MSKNQNRGIHDFAKYDSMATEELKDILRLDAEKPIGQASDEELLLYIMEVLAQRKRNSDNPGKTAHEAWESFQKHYLPEEGMRLEHTAEAKKAEKTPRLRLRRFVAAAAVIAILVSIPLTASAFRWEDVWNVVAKWLKETFSFVSGNEPNPSDPSPNNSKEYTSLQDALAKTNRDTDMVPTWIPAGYTLDRIIVDESPMQNIYTAMYRNGEQALKIRVQVYLNTDPEKVEINDTLLETYKVSDIEYFIFSNNQQLRAVWIKGSYECYISGNLTIDEIKTMIDSIGKG